MMMTMKTFQWQRKNFDDDVVVAAAAATILVATVAVAFEFAVAIVAVAAGASDEAALAAVETNGIVEMTKMTMSSEKMTSTETAVVTRSDDDDGDACPSPEEKLLSVLSLQLSQIKWSFIRQ
jgi:hypothetical protein